jgi:hypothetical protein
VAGWVQSHPPEKQSVGMVIEVMAVVGGMKGKGFFALARENGKKSFTLKRETITL